MRLKVRQIGPGLHPNEVIVGISSIEGPESLRVHRRSLRNDTIEVGWPVSKQGDHALVELPRETQTGAWRVWVRIDELLEDERMRA